jgi:hypothetical protein
MIDLPHYPRTFHLEGSKGISETEQVSLFHLEGKSFVIEEKVDDSCVSMHFDSEANLRICHRDQEARGPEFDRLKAWTAKLEERLFDVLQDRYILYGGWLYAVHTIYYNRLPHYFLEYDIYDRQRQVFLSTDKRQEVLQPLRDEIVSVQVLPNVRTLMERPRDYVYPPIEPWCVVGESCYVTSSDHTLHREFMQKYGRSDPRSYTGTRGVMEGLYIKVEHDGIVSERYKYIQHNFLAAILKNGSHWKDQPLIANVSLQTTGTLC